MPKKPAQKNFWLWAGLEPTSFCLADLKKAQLNSMPSASSLYAVGGSQLIKLIKSVTSLVLKKSLLFAPTKKRVTVIVDSFINKSAD